MDVGPVSIMSYDSSQSRGRARLDFNFTEVTVADVIKYKCGYPKCKSIMKTYNGIRQHWSYKHSKVGFRRRCKECAISFDRLKPYKIHMEEQHGLTMQVKCWYCSYVAIQDDDLKDHYNEACWSNFFPQAKASRFDIGLNITNSDDDQMELINDLLETCSIDKQDLLVTGFDYSIFRTLFRSL